MLSAGLHTRLHVLVACMLVCRLHVGLPLACQLACWLASPACELQPGCFCVVRLHVGLHVRLYVGCCHVVRLHGAPAACITHACMHTAAYIHAANMHTWNAMSICFSCTVLVMHQVHHSFFPPVYHVRLAALACAPRTCSGHPVRRRSRHAACDLHGLAWSL